MKVDLTMNSAGYLRQFEQAAHDANAFGKGSLAALMRVKDSLIAALRPVSDEEAFLAKSQNHADLERRILMLQAPGRHQSGW
jgi:hypothetical protein